VFGRERTLILKHLDAEKEKLFANKRILIN